MYYHVLSFAQARIILEQGKWCPFGLRSFSRSRGSVGLFQADGVFLRDFILRSAPSARLRAGPIEA